MSDNNNCFFRGQNEGEKIVKFTRKHWVYTLPYIIIFILAFVFFLILFINYAIHSNSISLPTNEPIVQLLFIIAVIIILYGLHKFFVFMINYFMCVVIFTNQRIVVIKRHLFIADTKDSMDLSRIQDVQFEQNGLIKNILKFGSVHIIVGNAETKTLPLIPNPDHFFRLINRLRNELSSQTPQSLPPQSINRDTFSQKK